MLKAVLYQVHTILTPLHPLQASDCPLSGKALEMPEKGGRGTQFAEQPRNRNTIYSRPMCFDMICEGETLSAIAPRPMLERIEHRLPPLEFRGSENSPLSVITGNRLPLPSRHVYTPRRGQRVGRMRTIKEGEADQEIIRRIIFPLNVKHFHHDQLRKPLADVLLRWGRQFSRRSTFPSSPTTSPADARPSTPLHTLQIYLQDLDLRTKSFHPKPDPTEAGTGA